MKPLTRSKQLELIAMFTTEIQLMQSNIEIVWYLTEHIISKFNFEDCVVYLMNADNNKLTQISALGPKNPSRFVISNPLELAIGEGIVGSAAKEKKTIYIPDLSKDPRYIVDDNFRGSELAVPILLNNQVLGVIDSEHTEKNFFSIEHIKLIECLAGITAPKIYIGNVIQKLKINQNLSLPAIMESVRSMGEQIKNFEDHKKIKDTTSSNLKEPVNTAISALQLLNGDSHAGNKKYIKLLENSLLELKNQLERI